MILYYYYIIIIIIIILLYYSVILYIIMSSVPQVLKTHANSMLNNITKLQFQQKTKTSAYCVHWDLKFVENIQIQNNR